MRATGWRCERDLLTSGSLALCRSSQRGIACHADKASGLLAQTGVLFPLGCRLVDIQTRTCHLSRSCFTTRRRSSGMFSAAIQKSYV